MIASTTIVEVERYDLGGFYRRGAATGTFTSTTTLYLSVKEGGDHAGSPIHDIVIKFGSNEPQIELADSGRIKASFPPDDLHIFLHALQKGGGIIEINFDENSRPITFLLLVTESLALENPRERLDVVRRLDPTISADSPPSS
jgi:hypothetical protein